MYKRVAVARTVAYCPKVMICDEPTRGADPDGTFVVTDMLKAFHERGREELREFGGRATVVIIHNKDSTRRLDCPILLVTKAGTVKKFSDFDSFYSSRDPDVNEYWGDYREKCVSVG
jgi:ABC-type transporter Mla maintaining outer membrane lipid asymmetry ATPase subunit MlaF